MAVDVDYYAVLGVARNADGEAIEAAVKKAMREWRKRTEASDLSVRQEAELKIKQIEEARATLLDAARRARYDQDLSGGVKQATPAAPNSGGGMSWLEQAEGYLGIGDYHSAAYAAREATQADGQSARTWWVRSRANAGLGQWQDAVYEARQATTIEANNADYHFNLGLIHEQMNAFDDAISEYRRAGTCDPSNPMYELAVGGVLATNGRLEQALPIIEAVYAKHPRDENANYYLGTLLIELAERVPASKTFDGYIVKSKDEIDQMRSLVSRATSLNIVDDDTKQAANNIIQYLDRMELRKFGGVRSFIMRGTAMGDTPGTAFFLAMLFIAILLLPLILVFAGFAAMADAPGTGFILLLVGGALGWVWWKLMYVPQWKHNMRDL